MNDKEPRLTGLWIMVIVTVAMMGWMVADMSGAFKPAPDRTVATAPRPPQKG